MRTFDIQFDFVYWYLQNISILDILTPEYIYIYMVSLYTHFFSSIKGRRWAE